MESSLIMRMPLRGVFYALLAAVLFGMTTPLAKPLLHEIEPVLLAGLFYLGSGLGLGLYQLYRKLTLPTQPSLRRPDCLWFAGAVIVGGIVAPILLMLGLSKTPAATASLFLNVEGVFTALLAWFVFKENYDARIFTGILLIALGGLILSFDFSAGLAITAGTILVVSACFGWAVDNNLTRNVSHIDPAQIACYKGLVAGAVNVAIAISQGVRFPSALPVLLAMLIGLVGYGVSLVLYVLALRHIGAARTGAYFSLAPFVGAAISIIVLKDKITPQLITAASLMGIGLWLHLSETHDHGHLHETLEHEHEHIHDEHHRHDHSPDVPPGEPHVHRHTHSRLFHSHPHFPDLHHHHEH